MLTSPGQITKPELLIINSKRLRQAGITHLLDVWADAMGLTVKTLVPSTSLDTFCAHNCEMTIISVGGEFDRRCPTACVDRKRAHAHAPNTLGHYFRPGGSRGDMRCF